MAPNGAVSPPGGVQLRAILFSFILFLAKAGAVTPDQFVLPLDADLNGRPSLSPREMIADLAFLSRALDRAYAGPAFGHRLRQISTREGSSRDFCERLARLLDTVPDAHLRAGLNFEACGARYPRGQVGANLAREGWLRQTVNGADGPIEVLAVPKFWSREDRRWEGFLDAVRDLRRADRPWILDLRGNGGGDDAMGVEMARILFGISSSQEVPSPVAQRRFRQTPEVYALGSNHWTLAILRLRRAGQPVPPYMEERRREMLTFMDCANHGQFTEEYIEELPKAAVDAHLVFPRQVTVLVDRECASACETTLQFLENLPHRRLVGENTLGVVEYGEVGRVVLPHSRVMIALSSMSVSFHDGRQVEKRGYSPDVTVPSGQDALRFITRTWP